MKLILRITGIFLAALALIILLLVVLDYSYVLRGFQVVYLSGHTTAYIDDYPNLKTVQLLQEIIIGPGQNTVNTIPPHLPKNFRKPI